MSEQSASPTAAETLDSSQPSFAPDSCVISVPGPGVAPEPEPEMETAAAQIVAALEAAGVNTYFGVPGGPVMPLFDAILRSPTVKLVESRHETNAVFSAVGYHRATGKVPAVVVTAGPGATNAVTGIVSAHLERVPMIIISGDVAWAASGGRLLQSLGREGIGIEDMVKNVTRAQVRVALPRSAASQAMAALKAATAAENPGPALLVLPIDCGAQPTEWPQIESIRTAVTSHIDDHVLVDVAELLSNARRPLIVVGNGCRPHSSAVQRMIEALRVPFMTTPAAKGVISEDHHYSLRNGGMAASWWARRYTQSGGGVDVALVLGTDLDDVSVGPTPPIAPEGTLIHVDLDPTVFNRNVPTRLGITCELGAFARRLREMTREMSLGNRQAAFVMAEATEAPPFDNERFRSDDQAQIAPHRVIHDLEAAVGPHATYVTDIGEHMLFALHYLTASGPNSFAIHLALGSMASGICSAIGQAARRSGPPRGVHLRRRRDADGRQRAARRGQAALAHRLRRLQRRSLQHGLSRLPPAVRQGGHLGHAVGGLRGVGRVDGPARRAHRAPGPDHPRAHRRADRRRLARRARHPSRRLGAHPRRGPGGGAAAHVRGAAADARALGAPRIDPAALLARAPLLAHAPQRAALLRAATPLGPCPAVDAAHGDPVQPQVDHPAAPRAAEPGGDGPWRPLG